MGGIASLPFQQGATWAEVPFRNSVIGNFMVLLYQDRLEANLLQLFVHAKNSEWISIISAIVFEVNVVAARKQT